MKIVWLFVYPLLISVVTLVLFGGLFVFKKMATMSVEELNDAKKTDRGDLTTKDANLIRRVGIIIFVLGGNFIWSTFGATFGAVAREITTHVFFRWVAYVLVYLLMVTIFRIIHKGILSRFEMAYPSLEIVFFSLMMIFMFVLSVCCESNIPKLFSWHLVF